MSIKIMSNTPCLLCNKTLEEPVVGQPPNFTKISEGAGHYDCVSCYGYNKFVSDARVLAWLASLSEVYTLLIPASI